MQGDTTINTAENNNKKVKGGSFKTMGLSYNLIKNITFNNPTPIQRKTIPKILEGRSIMGIARTGSGKTLCYLIPAIEYAAQGKKVVIICPTKELVRQVEKNLAMYARRISFKKKIKVTTVNNLFTIENSQDGIEENNNAKNNAIYTDLLIVDEFDRIMEEEGMKSVFTEITQNYTKQRVYFSATLPNDPIQEISTIIKLECKIPESISHFFYYVPSENKESALISLLDEYREKNENTNDLKCMIFASTKYGVDLLVEILNFFNYNALGVYSGMDDEARKSNLDAFVNNKVNYLVVTDVAARGLDIPHLNVSISYDMCDEKTFVHRVGRVRGVGQNISLVTYSDVFHYFNVKETHLQDNVQSEIGMLPQEMLDKYNMSRFDYSRQKAARGYQKCLRFRQKVSVPSEYKMFIDTFDIHSRFRKKETLAGQIKQMRARKIEGNKKETTKVEEKKEFRDQFYIPYSKKETLIHSSAFGIAKDDYITEKKTKQRIYFRKKHNSAKQTQK